jgi:hypothetical protein
MERLLQVNPNPRPLPKHGEGRVKKAYDGEIALAGKADLS